MTSYMVFEAKLLNDKKNICPYILRPSFVVLKNELRTTKLQRKPHFHTKSFFAARIENNLSTSLTFAIKVIIYTKNGDTGHDIVTQKLITSISWWFKGFSIKKIWYQCNANWLERSYDYFKSISFFWEF